MKKENLILIGMPSSGKSMYGKKVAKLLSIPFIDTDKLIVEKEGMPLIDVIEHKGLKYFLQTESEILSSLKVNGCVIATGGSAVYSADAMQRLKKSGITVYICTPVHEIKKRLGDYSRRGVAAPESFTVSQIYKERHPLYLRNADCIVATRRKSIKTVTMEIANLYISGRKK